MSDVIRKVFLGLVLSLASVGVGYQVGALTTRVKSNPNLKEELKESPPAIEEEEVDEQAISDGDLKCPIGFMEPCKLVLVVRTDLKLTPASIATQLNAGARLPTLLELRNNTFSSHATLACYKALSKKNSSVCIHYSLDEL
uniref:Uncharacterized protein n=1 Tax=Psilocybe cubensis TaxID=181762 RepID=A0A8H8CR03_PSICU